MVYKRCDISAIDRLLDAMASTMTKVITDVTSNCFQSVTVKTLLLKTTYQIDRKRCLLLILALAHGRNTMTHLITDNTTNCVESIVINTEMIYYHEHQTGCRESEALDRDEMVVDCENLPKVLNRCRCMNENGEDGNAP